MLPVGKLDVQALIMNRFATLVTLICLLALAGCETPGPTVSTDVRALEQRAGELIEAGDLERSVEAYTQLANASGGRDNITVVVVDVESCEADATSS